MHIFFQNNQYLGSYYFTRSADDPVICCFCPRQVLTKKLDSLEEFRQQKEQLMNKFEKLESDSKQKMDDYEKRLYDLEKSHIREQDRLKVRL